MRVSRRVVASIAVSVVVAACGGGDGSGADPSASPADEVAAGASLYAAHCAECHGEDLRGTDRGPSFLSRVYEPGHHADFAFQIAVQRGVRAHHWQFDDMPPIEGVSESEVDSIVAFVRDTQTREGFEP